MTTLFTLIGVNESDVIVILVIRDQLLPQRSSKGHLRAVFFLISPRGKYNPSQIYMILWYVLPHNVIGKTVKQFGSILFSFGFIARTFLWNLVQYFFKKRVFSRIFNFLEFFAKPKFSNMIIYAKTHSFVSYNFLGWLRCAKSSLNHLTLYGSNFCLRKQNILMCFFWDPHIWNVG